MRLKKEYSDHVSLENAGLNGFLTLRHVIVLHKQICTLNLPNWVYIFTVSETYINMIFFFWEHTKNSVIFIHSFVQQM